MPPPPPSLAPPPPPPPFLPIASPPPPHFPSFPFFQKTPPPPPLNLNPPPPSPITSPPPLGANNFYDLLSLLPALLLTLPTPRRTGLTPGNIRPHWWKVLIICAIPILLTAIIYPLTSKPFKNVSIGMW